MLPGTCGSVPAKSTTDGALDGIVAERDANPDGTGQHSIVIEEILGMPLTGGKGGEDMRIRCSEPCIIAWIPR